MGPRAGQKSRSARRSRGTCHRAFWKVPASRYSMNRSDRSGESHSIGAAVGRAMAVRNGALSSSGARSTATCSQR